MQAHCTPEKAFVLMTQRVEQTGYRMEEIAKAVVERQIRFDEPPTPTAAA